MGNKNGGSQGVLDSQAQDIKDNKAKLDELNDLYKKQLERQSELSKEFQDRSLELSKQRVAFEKKAYDREQERRDNADERYQRIYNSVVGNNTSEDQTRYLGLLQRELRKRNEALADTRDLVLQGSFSDPVPTYHPSSTYGSLRGNRVDLSLPRVDHHYHGNTGSHGHN